MFWRLFDTGCLSEHYHTEMLDATSVGVIILVCSAVALLFAAYYANQVTSIPISPQADVGERVALNSSVSGGTFLVFR